MTRQQQLDLELSLIATVIDVLQRQKALTGNKTSVEYLSERETFFSNRLAEINAKEKPGLYGSEFVLAHNLVSNAYDALSRHYDDSSSAMLFYLATVAQVRDELWAEIRAHVG